jgi:hypothetical protein
MNIYIYKKTHVKTGLKYLGKTIQKDPHKYKGSGIRWLNHIKVHGYDVVTEILKVCSSKEEAAQWGKYYSVLYNIVESREWANLKPETGDGGGTKPSLESIQKQITTRKKNGTLNTNSPESISKARATRERNNTLNTNTAQSIAKKLESRTKNGTLWQDPKIIQSILDTKIANGTLNSRTSDSIKKTKGDYLNNRE